jgi:hypothetical protein
MLFKPLTFVSAISGLASLASAFVPEAKSNVAIYYVGLSVFSSNTLQDVLILYLSRAKASLSRASPSSVTQRRSILLILGSSTRFQTRTPSLGYPAVTLEISAGLKLTRSMEYHPS